MAANPVVSEGVDDQEPELNTGIAMSEPEVLWKCLFEKEDIGLQFLDLVIETFKTLEDNTGEKNETFDHHIDFIIKWTIADITSETCSNRSWKRIDSYFYIFRRIHEHIEKLQQSHESLTKINESIFHLIIMIFKETKGEEPNLITEDKEVLSKINIMEHLSLITSIDDQSTLLKFFVLMKLSMQTKKCFSQQGPHVLWIDTLKTIQSTKCGLSDFIKLYREYKKAFEQFPLDTSAIMYLIRRMHTSVPLQGSPFLTFIGLHQQINPDINAFYEQFLSVFSELVKDKRYTIQNVSELLSSMKQSDQRFRQYFEAYLSTSNVTRDDIFNMFLSLSKLNALNDMLRRYFSEILPRRFSSMQLEEFFSIRRSGQGMSQSY